MTCAPLPAARAPAGIWLPLAVACAVIGIDWVEGPRVQFATGLTAVPFLAAVFAGPGATGVVGACCLAMVTAFGFVQYTATGGLVAGSGAQFLRLGLIAAAAFGAVLAAAGRRRREERLAEMTLLAEATRAAHRRPVEEQLGPVRCALSDGALGDGAPGDGDVVEMAETPFGVRWLLGRASGTQVQRVRSVGHVQAAFREHASSTADLGSLCVQLGAAVRAGSPVEQRPVTALVGEIRRDGFLHVACCGHSAPLLIAAGSGLRQPLVSEPVDPPLERLTCPAAPMSWRLSAGDRVIARSAPPGPAGDRSGAEAVVLSLEYTGTEAAARGV